MSPGRRDLDPEREKAIRAARAARDEAAAVLEARTAELHALIYEALDAGDGPSATGRASGYTREYVAKLRDNRSQ